MEKVTGKTIMWFGKYKGIALANIPADYLLYLYNANKVFGSLKDYIKDNLDALKKEYDESHTSRR